VLRKDHVVNETAHLVLCWKFVLKKPTANAIKLANILLVSCLYFILFFYTFLLIFYFSYWTTGVWIFLILDSFQKFGTNATYKFLAERLTRVSRLLEVWNSNPEPAKSCTALQTIRHRLNIYASSCVASALWRGDGHRKLVIRLGVIWRV